MSKELWKDFVLSTESPVPFKGKLSFVRSGTEPLCNVPWILSFHSPDGFEWGYGGSGPADLALNILAMFVSEQTAWDLHHDFKWDVVSCIPYQGGYFSSDFVVAWLRKKGIDI